MWQTFKFLVLSAGLLMTGYALLAVFGIFNDLGFHGTLAAVLGIIFTTVVAIGLMALIFSSDRSQHDREVHKSSRTDRW